MNRRTFLGTSTAMGLSGAAQAAKTRNQYIELRFYNLSGGAGQSSRLAAFLENEHLPMTKRLRIGPVGYFDLRETPAPRARAAGKKSADAAPGKDAPRIVTLTAYDSWPAVEAKQNAQRSDKQWTKALNDLTAQAPIFDRVESWLLRAFDGLPKIEVPPVDDKKKPRIFDLRVAESLGFGAAADKREQFNSGGEIQIFRNTGLHPLLFGESLFGSKMPNLWFMVWFDDREAREAAWEAFFKDPEWLKIQKVPRWAKAVFRTTDSFLQPLRFSPIR
jgi:hypothetical protein